MIRLMGGTVFIFNPFAPAAKSLSDLPENLCPGWKKFKNNNTF
jgi:hypothetical protein